MNATLLLKFVGESVYARHDKDSLKERVHSAMIIVYLVFLAAFGIGSFVDSVQCVPVNDTLADDVSDAEAKYASKYCQDNAHLQDPNMKVFRYVLISLSVILGIDGIAEAFIEPSLSCFTAAGKLFAQLPDKCSSGESLFNEFLEDPEATELREIVTFLRANIGKTTWFHLAREVLLPVGLLTWAVIFLRIAPRVVVTFTCDVKSSGSTSGTIPYTCVRPWALDYNNIVCLYKAALFAHATILFVLFICEIVNLGRKGGLCWNGNFNRAAVCLYIANLGSSSRPDKARFNEFIRFVMKKGSRPRFTGIVKSIGKKADPLMTEFAIPSVSIAQTESREGAQRSSDSRGAASASETAAVPQRPNASELASKKLWRWVIFLLNRNFSEVDTPALLANNEPDGNGNSLLYYALNRQRGNTFKARTATKILDHKGIVLYKGMQMTDEEFIQEQYLQDQQYPERLKDHLMAAIRNRQQD